MQDYPIKIGQMLFTLVDPNRGHEVDYNRWYEREHFYAGCMIGPGWFAGSRWVAPRSLKDLRFPADSPFARPVDAGSYLSIYWVHLGNLEEANNWAQEQVVWLYANGRGFPERTHAHTGMYRPDSTAHADEAGVPVELALDHKYRGLGVVVVEPSEGTPRDTLIQELESGPARRLMDGREVDMVCSWKVIPRPADTPAPMSLGTDGGSTERVLQLCFLNTEPESIWDRFHAYAKEIDQSGVGSVTFAAPFVPTVVGTDTYADQLCSGLWWPPYRRPDGRVPREVTMAELKIVHVDDVPAIEVKAQMHGLRRVGAHLRFLEQTPTRSFFHCRYDPGMTLEEHGHASDHAIFVLKGSVAVGEVECGEGTLVVLEHGRSFGPLVAGPGGTELLEFYAGDPAPVPADPERFAALLDQRGIVAVSPTFRADPQSTDR